MAVNALTSPNDGVLPGEATIGINFKIVRLRTVLQRKNFYYSPDDGEDERLRLGPVLGDEQTLPRDRDATKIVASICALPGGENQ